MTSSSPIKDKKIKIFLIDIFSAVKKMSRWLFKWGLPLLNHEFLINSSKVFSLPVWTDGWVGRFNNALVRPLIPKTHCWTFLFTSVHSPQPFLQPSLNPQVSFCRRPPSFLACSGGVRASPELCKKLTHLASGRSCGDTDVHAHYHTYEKLNTLMMN